MQLAFRLAAITGLILGAANLTSAQSVTFDFQDGTDQGWGNAFSDASASFPIDNIGGSLRMRVLRDGSFQEAERNAGNDGSPFFQAMLAASNAEALYQVSYDWYVDTSAFGAGAGTFLQVGTYVNTGNGFYAQDFPAAGKDVELGQAELASGFVFSGTVTETFSAKGIDMPAGQTFFRFGFIINGNGSSQAVHFDNVVIAPVPEPASLALFGLALPALALRRRRAA